jgi:hypothetical protein
LLTATTLALGDEDDVKKTEGNGGQTIARKFTVASQLQLTRHFSNDDDASRYLAVSGKDNRLMLSFDIQT